eukprot:TRINITY_DN21807_c1_g1_i1.p1 TRINITY_DN21807_c1_g1~~TRINITY_DN21807_c1_g1_i1.p1  ORF type:complete len:326 (+),score=61.61 TRINITY_DN21807_c1_g1_i1:59-1036(+)
MQSADSRSSTLLNGRYCVKGTIGKGHFGKVYRAVDAKDGNKDVAIKVLGQRYSDGAKIERMILRTLANADPKMKRKFVRHFDDFGWNKCSCIVMSLHGPPLSKRKLGVMQGHFPRSHLVLLARQLAEALTFIHGRCALIHTDLKPDNILQDHDGGWVIADFGNSFFHIEGEYGTDLITTRPYRSPEVVIRKAWKHPTDMWSVGCILYEVFTGEMLFNTSNGDSAHIGMMTAKLGPIPGLKYKGQPMFSKAGSFLQSKLGSDAQLLNLVKMLLEYEPTDRLRAKEMSKHPFVTSGSQLGSLLVPQAPTWKQHFSHPYGQKRQSVRA